MGVEQGIASVSDLDKTKNLNLDMQPIAMGHFTYNTTTLNFDLDGGVNFEAEALVSDDGGVTGGANRDKPCYLKFLVANQSNNYIVVTNSDKIIGETIYSSPIFYSEESTTELVRLNAMVNNSNTYEQPNGFSVVIYGGK